jgi:hypothetical protein
LWVLFSNARIAFFVGWREYEDKAICTGGRDPFLHPFLARFSTVAMKDEKGDGKIPALLDSSR